MATEDLVQAAYESIGRTSPDAEGVAFWTEQLESGAITPGQFTEIFLTAAAGVTNPEYATNVQQAQDLLQSYAPSYSAEPTASGFLTGAFINQLGREPTAAEIAYYSNQLSSGAVTENTLLQQLNQSLEGQNFDTQYLTSQYRSLFGRNPEQEGFQYWISMAQSDPNFYGQSVTDWLRTAAANMTPEQYALSGSLPVGAYTNLNLPSLESDPYGGRFTSVSRYITDPSAYPNVSYIGDQMYQFMSPITQRPIISRYAPESWAAQVGLDVLSAPQVDAAIKLALNSGTINQQDYESLYNDLVRATSMEDVYAALNKPQASVIVDALYGFQTGEAKTLEEAQREAGVRQQYLDQFGYYPSNFAMADVLAKAGVEYPFTLDEMQRMGQLYKPGDVVTPENFRQKLGQVVNMSFGGSNFMPTDIGTEYYSERGLEPGFTPFDQGPTFRSGVAGYTPETISGFQFGVPGLIAPIQGGPQGFQPGIFNTGAKSYSQSGIPLDSMGRPLTQVDPMGNPISGDTIYNFNPANYFAGFGGQLFPTQAEAQASFPDSGGGA